MTESKTKAVGYPESILQMAAKIKLLLMDVDGVLTDGKLYYLRRQDGEDVEFKAFNSQDGLGFHMLNGEGIKTGVISGRVSPALEARGKILEMSYIYQGHLEKVAIWEEILKHAGLSDDQVAFIGDDFTDAPLIRRAGLGCVVADARPELRGIAGLVTQANGGQGAVREVIELILKSQNRWQSVLTKYKL